MSLNPGAWPSMWPPTSVVAPQCPANACAADAEGLGDLGATKKPLRFQFTHPDRVYRGQPALVDARGLGLGDPLKLALPAQVRLKLREHSQLSRKYFPAAVLVSIGCSVALREAPRAFTVRMMS
jgi:hypothetical protein